MDFLIWHLAQKVKLLITLMRLHKTLVLTSLQIDGENQSSKKRRVGAARRRRIKKKKEVEKEGGGGGR